MDDNSALEDRWFIVMPRLGGWLYLAPHTVFGQLGHRWELHPSSALSFANHQDARTYLQSARCFSSLPHAQLMLGKVALHGERLWASGNGIFDG